MERIVLVDENDNFVGEEEKEKCHDGGGILHRAFLAMVFNRSGDLVLARRSASKRLWPGFWDGTVASHVFKSEDYEQASRRRLLQEIGLATQEARYLFKFHYCARYEDAGAENEICAVTVVKDVDFERIQPNDGEISGIECIPPGKLMDELRRDGKRYTPWLRLALEHMDRQRLI